MAKKWLKFDCINCKKPNWLYEDINIIATQKSIACCIYCGFVKGYAEKEERIDAGTSWLKCIELTGIALKHTRGPVSPDGDNTAQTRWGTSDASGPKEGLDRVSYMLKYGFDPWFDFCSRENNSDKKICQNDGFGRSFKDRLKTSVKPRVDSDTLE
jgi:hypothetical protein